MKSILRLYREWRFRRSTWVDRYGTRWVKEGWWHPGEFFRSLRRLRRTLPSAEAYLRAHAKDYPWGELWLLHGQSFPAPPRSLCHSKVRDGSYMPEGNCYGNSLALSRAMAEKVQREGGPFKFVLYAEGLAVDPTGAWLHAWLVIDGRVHDPTWPGAYMATYFGVTFEPEWADEVAEKMDVIGMTLRWDLFHQIVTEKLNEN